MKQKNGNEEVSNADSFENSENADALQASNDGGMKSERGSEESERGSEESERGSEYGDSMNFNVPYENCFERVFKVKTERKTRIRRKATSGWSSKLAMIFWNAKKLSCVAAWKRANVGSELIKCVGYCTVTGCSAKLQCEATINNLRFSISGRDPQFVHNPKKREEFCTSNRMYTRKCWMENPRKKCMRNCLTIL